MPSSWYESLCTLVARLAEFMPGLHSSESRRRQEDITSPSREGSTSLVWKSTRRSTKGAHSAENSMSVKVRRLY